MSITVILNGYKRGKQLTEQLNALNNGTVKPDEILLWYNNPGDDFIN
jgi:GT2 family glycosyltransferase